MSKSSQQRKEKRLKQKAVQKHKAKAQKGGQQFLTVQGAKNIMAYLEDQIERRCRIAELNMRRAARNLIADHEVTRANQIVMLNMLKNNSVISAEEYYKEYDYYYQNKMGIITTEGKMRGSIAMEMYNFAKEKTCTSAWNMEGGGPATIVR